MLRKCLDSLVNQSTERAYEVIVVDNDAAKTAEVTGEKFTTAFWTRGCKLRYAVECEQNIALARNKAVSLATGEYIAFIDDDEEAYKDWLETLCNTLEREQVDGVFGLVIKVRPETVSLRLWEAGFFEDLRAGKPASRIAGMGGRTNNAIIRKIALAKREGPFDKHLGRTGGEDVELFSWLDDHAYKLYWCPEARVREYIDSRRATVGWQFHRAYRSGWVRAKLVVDRRGRALAASRLLPQALLGSMMAVCLLLLNLRSPTVAIIKFARTMGSQLGKYGFFLGIRVIGYKG